MMDDFFQKQPAVPPGSVPKHQWRRLFQCVFYTSLVGFVSGSALGYFHIKGWAPDAEKNLILYGITFGMGAILSTAFVLYQERQNQLKVERIRCLETSKPSQER